MEVYYDNEMPYGINATIHTVDGVHYEYFSSMYMFNCFVSLECPTAKVVEVTDENYEQLREQGKVS